MKTTQKEIKEYNAIDITYIGFNDMKKLREEEEYFKEIAYSKGMYGVNGCVVQGNKTGKLYKICSRTSALFMAM